MKASEVIKQYQNGQHNFQGQNLRGANFQGQDLTGADFSGCDIRGANFSNANLTKADFSEADIRNTNFKDANLTGVNFSRATAGLQEQRVKILSLQVLVLIYFLESFLSQIKTLISAILDPSHHFPIIEQVSLIYLIIFSFISYRQNLLWGLGLGTLTITLVQLLGQSIIDGTRERLPLIMLTMSQIVPLVLVFIIVFALVFAVVLIVDGGEFGILIENFLTITILYSLWSYGVFDTIRYFYIYMDFSYTLDNIFYLIVQVAFVIILTLFPYFIAYRSLKNESKDSWLRHIALVIASLGGTTFYNADLTDANFTNATLKNTDLRAKSLTHTCFKDTIKLDLARAGKTIIANPKVRDLLINPGSGNGQDYFKADLRGANLNGANLQSAILKQADLSEASCQYANLRDANLTEVNAIKTDFSHATLTGATLEAWNIDQDTDLREVECEYVFLLEKKNKKGSRERRPHDPDSIFKEGDFTRLYQKALNTLELFLRDGMNPDAFRQAFDKIMEDNPEITYDSIQSVEKKGKDVLVTVKVSEDTDKGKVEKNFNQNYTQAQLELAKAQGRLEEKEKANQDLKEIIQSLAHKPMEIKNINQNHSGDGDNVGNDKLLKG